MMDERDDLHDFPDGLSLPFPGAEGCGPRIPNQNLLPRAMAVARGPRIPKQTRKEMPMADWRLQLTEDSLRRIRPAFPTLAERLAAYEDFYFPAGSKKALSGEETAPEQWTGQGFPESAALDIRQTQSPFSTLLCFYDTAGNEYTFSQAGMRHMRRTLPWQGHYHTHDYIEILLCLKGSFRQILLGEPRTFAAGEVVITDRNLEHADMLEGEADTAVLFLSLQADYLDQLLSSHGSQDDLQRFFFHALQRQRKDQSYIHLQPAPGPSPGRPPESAGDRAWRMQLSRLLEVLIEEDYSPGPGSEEIIRGSLIRLLSLLCRRYSTRLHSSDQESKERALLYELERYLRLHFATVTASELEEAFHYHRNFYNLLLQKYRGTTFREYLQDIRMQHAARLLKDTRFSVRDIALAAGYHNSSHFYHLFQRHFGVSPATYRADA